MMEKLTKLDSYGHYFTNEKINDRMQPDEPFPHAYDGRAIDKLAEYENAEEQGLLIRLPCRVGDLVYRILPYEDFIMESIVEEFVFSNIVYVIVRDKLFNNRRGIPYCEKGKTFFLTKEEAEAALQARKKEGAE